MVILWHIWKARCTLVFDQIHQSPQIIISKIKDFCGLHKIGYVSSSTSQHVASLRSHNSDHCQMSDSSANDANSFQLNVDASVLPNTHVAGTAFILADSTGSFVTATASPIWARNVIHAEMLALYKALCWLCSHQPSNVVIYSDCKKLVDGLGGSVNNVSWIDRSLLFECVSLLYSLSNVTVRYIRRMNNKAADQLAKFARCQVCNIQWWYTLSAVLQSTVTGSM